MLRYSKAFGSNRIPSWLLSLELHAGLIGFIALAVLLIGWGAFIPTLTTVFSDMPSMKPVTAISIISLSVACIFSLRSSRFGVIVSATIGALLSLSMLFLLLFDNDRSEMGIWALEPSLATKFALMLAGLSYALFPFAKFFSTAIAIIALGVSCTSLLRALDLLFFHGAVLVAGPFDSMAIHTSILITWFMVVCVLMHPRLGIGMTVFQVSLRGRVLRRSLLILVAVPLASYILALPSRSIENASVSVLFVMFAGLSIVAGAVLTWWISALLEEYQSNATELSSNLSTANQHLKRFAFDMAHDLRAPIRNLKVYSELAVEALEADNVEGAKTYLNRNISGGEKLIETIEKTLDNAKTAYRQPKFSTYRVSELIDASARLLQNDLDEAECRIEIDGDAEIICDASMLETLFLNLMSNSIKYRIPDQQLNIYLKIKEEKSAWRLSFRDNGTGFNPEFVSRAFDPLAVDLSTGSKEGTGLGLATCQTIVEAHKGQIWIESNISEGACISWTIPKAPDVQTLASIPLVAQIA